MRVLLQELEKSGFGYLGLDTRGILDGLGLNLDDDSCLNLTEVPIELLDELLVRSLMWIERVSEVLALTNKAKLDLSLARNKAENDVLKSLRGVKVAEARATAESSPSVIDLSYKVNLLSAYEGYLERLLKNLDRYHYVIKSRSERLRLAERKY